MVEDAKVNPLDAVRSGQAEVLAAIALLSAVLAFTGLPVIAALVSLWLCLRLRALGHAGTPLSAATRRIALVAAGLSLLNLAILAAAAVWVVLEMFVFFPRPTL